METKNLLHLLERNLDEGKRGITFISNKQDHEITYSELYQKSLQILGYLQKKGLKPGAEVVLQTNEVSVFIHMFWSCIMGGFIPIPLTAGNTSEHKSKLIKVWKQLNDPYLFVDQKSSRILNSLSSVPSFDADSNTIKDKRINYEEADCFTSNGIQHYANPDEIAFIQFSSGSTGDPKGVMLTHENVLTNLEGIVDADPYRWAGDTFFSWMPLTHDLGLIGFHLAPVAAKIHHYLMPTNLFIRSPQIWLDKVHQYRASVLSSPNFGYKFVIDRLKPENKAGLDLSSVRKIINGAEPISYDISKQFLEEFQPYGLKQDVMVPSYGMAEAAVGVTFPVENDGFYPIYIDRSSLKVKENIKELSSQIGNTAIFVSLGKAIKGTMIRICDEECNDLGENKVGQVHIKGKNVTKGYYNNPKATENAITYDGWLVTGDLGFLKNGELIITGREKDIIFINGQNYYPHDIERVAEGIEGIDLGKVVVCGAFNKELQSEEVIVFVIHRGSIEDFAPIASQLRIHLNRELAINIASVLPIKKIPRTTSGKVQRYILSQEYEDGKFSSLQSKVNLILNEEREARYIYFPQNEIEFELVTYFKKTLGLDQISIYDHFFEMGGNSLKASQLLGLIIKKFQIEITFEELFSLPTVKKLAEYIQKSAEKKDGLSVISPINEMENFPITPMQKKIYFMQYYQDIGTTYNVSVALKISGKFNKEQAQMAFQMLVNRHESLRTNFTTKQGDIKQIVRPSLKVNLETIHSVEEKQLGSQFIRPFNLESDPLIRMAISEVSENEHILLLDTHHIVVDRISINILLHEFTSLYEGKDVPSLSVQYKDFAVWQERQKESKSYTEHKEYWRSLLEGDLPILEFPTDYSRAKIQNFKGAVMPFAVNGSLLEDLRKLANEKDTTLYMVLLAAFQVLLFKYSGQEDIIVGTPVAGRYHPDIENVVGMFVNTLPLRSFPESKKSFISFLNETKKQIVNALKHQSYHTEELLNDLSLIKDPSRNPLFDMVFVMQNMESGALDIDGLDIKEIPIFSDSAKFDLTLEAIETDDNIAFNVEYCSDLFKPSTIRRFIDHYRTLLNEIINHPSKLLSNINILSEKERVDVLYHFNNTARAFPKQKTIHQLFEEKVQKTPNAIALLFENKKMTYYELNKMANDVAATLTQEGIGHGDYVGVFLNRGFEMVVGVLGILKAGSAYVPLDPSLPKMRFEHITNSLKIKALIINEKQRRRAVDLLEGHKHLALLIDPYQLPQNKNSGEIPSIRVNSEDNAYVIFTSGSTGVPNGVRVTHRSVVNLIDWVNREFSIGPADRVLFLTSLSFDLSVYDIFGMLAAGGSIRIVPDEELRNPVKLLEWLTTEPITLWDSAPAAFGQIVPFLHNARAENSKLRYVFLSGDWIPLATPQSIEGAFPSAKLISLGGATEATVWSNFYPVDKLKSDWKSIPYGKPIQNAQYYILNKDLQPCPIGVPGELYIAGECLSEGYINSPQLNNARFLTNPFVDSPSAKIYKTGDKARWYEDGNIEFLGRLDFQVKIRGYRIELGEIQSVLSKHDAIKEAYVITKENKLGENALCAYILSDIRIQPSELRGYLAEKIPEYMIPSYFIVLDKLPVTSNGKLDRKALPEPDSSIDLGQQYVPPKNKTEEILVSIWEELLGIEKIGTHDNFFALGGDSIKAIQAAARLDKYHLKMEINDLFKYPTISAISAHVKKNIRDVDQGTVEGDVHLSPVQSWFFEQEFEDNFHFNQAFLIKAKNGLDTKKVQQVFDRLLEHHDALRIGIRATNDGIKLFNHGLSVKAPKIAVYDFTTEIDSEMLITKEAEKLQRKINLSHPPYMKLAQFNTTEGAYLLIVFHHLIIDGVSWRILFEDFVNGYKNIVSEKDIIFPPKMDSFQVWTNQLNEYRKSKELEAELPYWNELKSYKTIPLPKEVHESTIKNDSANTIGFRLDDRNTENLVKQAGQAFNTDVETILLTALSLSIYDWISHSNVLVTLEGHGREAIFEDMKIDRTIGWFTSMYPLLLKTDPNKGLGYQIKQVKEQLMKVPNGGIGYGLLEYDSVAPYEKNSKIDIQPEISFNYLGQFDHELDGEAITLSDLSIGDMVSPNARKVYSLNFNSYVKQNQFVLLLEYSNNEYLDSTMEWFIDHYKQHLLNLIDYCINVEPEITPSDLTFKDFDIDELEEFIKEVAIGLVDEE
ncbi:non-ribosomal peptide synthetase [Cytobacillus dafuensis]|uniref:Non-ribosomal peptide synthase n=1 Tax=Cytobacillus dafuensis TaxID=1742359 RepID=A0A5B8Z206_CYTDA|nr:non-ribosomal peptide synthetase [Cytobacillus dafuensis]QED47025.1 non-ribosomal peptide synthase [Cytobacillus dafuensis]